jgi:nicotinate dehydrogenase subunit B
VSYPILTMPEAPTVEIALLNHPEDQIFGAGEAASAPVAGALANAVFDATGAVLRVAPFIPERVKAALV